MGGIRNIDCLRKFFEAVIYRYKKQWSVIIFVTARKYLWIDTNKHEWARRNTMKMWKYSLHTSSNTQPFSQTGLNGGVFIYELSGCGF